MSLTSHLTGKKHLVCRFPISMQRCEKIKTRRVEAFQSAKHFFPLSLSQLLAVLKKKPLSPSFIR